MEFKVLAEPSSLYAKKEIKKKNNEIIHIMAIIQIFCVYIFYIFLLYNHDWFYFNDREGGSNI